MILTDVFYDRLRAALTFERCLLFAILIGFMASRSPHWLISLVLLGGAACWAVMAHLERMMEQLDYLRADVDRRRAELIARREGLIARREDLIARINARLDEMGG